MNWEQQPDAGALRRREPAAVESWFLAHADRTRIIGSREVAGEAAVGFAAPLAEVVGPQPLGLEPDGEIRVWASAETAIPNRVEIEKRLGDG